MYEAKYSKYVTKSSSRFADKEEIIEDCVKIDSPFSAKGCGAVLYGDENTLYVDNSDVHTYIQGATGSKKTRIEAMLIILSTIMAGENMVINDPKGELYRKTAVLAEKQGYHIRVLNLRDPSKSHGWNPLYLSRRFDLMNDTANAEQAVSDFKVTLTGPAKEKTNDVYWPDMAGEVLKYCMLLLKSSVPDEYYNMANLIQLSHECNCNQLRELLKRMNQNTGVATSMHAVLDLTAEKTSSCIFSAVKQILIPFYDNRTLLEMLCCNDIDFEELLHKKTVFYVMYPDEKNSLGFLINLFHTQCYQYLVARASAVADKQLPVRVNFILDEFGNLPPIDNFENRISEARGHNIRYFLFSQSFGQLKNKYKENADTIIANCEWIIFPGKDISFYETVSKMCGRERDYYGNEHDLIGACELQHLKKTVSGTEALILKSGNYPFVTKLPDYEYVKVFGKYALRDVPLIEHNHTFVNITFEDWICGLGTKFKLPYPKVTKKNEIHERRQPNLF